MDEEEAGIVLDQQQRCARQQSAAHRAIINFILLEFSGRKDLVLWLNHTGCGRHKERVVRWGIPGSPPILGMRLPHGQIIAIDVAAGNTIRRTAAHETFRKNVLEMGGVYVRATCVDDVIMALMV